MSLWGRMKGVLFFVPKYGFYGAPHYGCGRYYKENGICPVPIDWMDDAFARHDAGESDAKLVERLKAGDPNELYYVKANLDWSTQAYAKFYRQLAIGWFSMSKNFNKKEN